MTPLDWKRAQDELDWRAAAESLCFGPPSKDIAKRHLLEQIRLTHRSYQVGWFHRELSNSLEKFSRAVTDGLSPRLLIAAPPRHGKSEAVSRNLPVWHLGRNPTHEIVVASYGQDLANDMSRDARAIRDRLIESWPHLAPGDRDGVEHWRIKGGGSYFAVGAGGPLTGRGCNILILDDLLKNYEEASSAVIRESRWNWYHSTAYTRLAPGGGILAMATRWHEDDPSGRMLRQLARGEEQWTVLRYPAIAEADEPYRLLGEALHPERYSLASLQRTQRVLSPQVFAALYQQRPTPAAGGLFLRSWMCQRYHWDPQRPPRPYTEVVVTVDATFKGTAGSAYNSIQAWGRYDWSSYYLLGEVHARMDYPSLRQSLRDVNRMYRPNAILIEEKANGAALIADLRTELPNVVGFVPDKYGDKVSRANLSTPVWMAGACHLPDESWVLEYVEELVSFPAGAAKDRVDAMSQLFLWWHQRRSVLDDGGVTAATNQWLDTLGME